MNYALVDAAGTALRYQDFDAPPPPLAPEKGLAWLEVVDVRPKPGPGEILTGPTATVDGAALRRVWTAAPAPPPPVPAAASMAQARVALARAGLLERVQAAVAAAGGETEIAWEYAATVNRDGALVAALSGALGLTAAQVDDLFRAAAEVRF